MENCQPFICSSSTSIVCVHKFFKLKIVVDHYTIWNIFYESFQICYRILQFKNYDPCSLFNSEYTYLCSICFELTKLQFTLNIVNSQYATSISFFTITRHCTTLLLSSTCSILFYKLFHCLVLCIVAILDATFLSDWHFKPSFFLFLVCVCGKLLIKINII